MIKNQVVRVKKDCTIDSIKLPLTKGQELEIVNDVVYMNGFMLQTSLQASIYDWIVDNPDLLDDITKSKNGGK